MVLLLDHFRPPLSNRRHWHAFHNAWATYLATDLNQRLPEGYFAEPNVQFGIEIDVATFQEPEHTTQSEPPTINNSTWQPPAPTQYIDFPTTDEVVEINIISNEGGPNLNAAIELISPANKDRPHQRNAFTAKCEAYLREGVSLAIVDVVTTRQANLHGALLKRLQGTENINGLESSAELYAAAYHAIQPAETNAQLQIWYETFDLGEALPTLPLWLRQGICLPLMLQETYAQTCQSQRIS